MNTLELLLHPVRLRIVWAMSGERVLTTSQLGAALPDVPRTTVYRHVGLLADAGVLEVVDEQRVRGVVERHYRLRPDQARIDAEAGGAMSLEDHRQGFAAAMAAMLAEFNAYLDRPGADPVADSIGYPQGTLWLSPGELTEMISELRQVFATRMGNKSTPERRAHLVSGIFFPADETPRPAL